MELPKLDSLKQKDIFVFQTNENGFHGAGSAGWAFNGKASGWQNNKKFQTQWNSGERVRGLFAILRQSSGLMAGTDGIGYGIVTCVTAAQPKSVPMSDIEAQLKELRSYTIRKPFLNFILASIGTGHAGYSQNEMWEMYISATEGRIPENWFIIKNKERVSFKHIFDSELKGKFICLR
ncbi:MAG: hypothetical protein RL634_236 [Bacteroidota bacterium]|jgi:hypothetical protein